MKEKLLTSPDERMLAINDNYRRITENIAVAAEKSGRSAADIDLCAVTKTVPVEYVNYSIELGVRHIGENRVQELASKFDLLEGDDLRISVIGHLQTNKTKQAVLMADMIQSLDSIHLAQEISKRAVDAGKTLDCLIEVNIGDEASKSGVAFAQAEELVWRAGEMPGIFVRGLMVIPPVEENILKTRLYFEKIHKLFIDIAAKKHDNNNIGFDILSMGMSSDYTAAIEEGANMVRIGSALYGARSYAI